MKIHRKINMWFVKSMISDFYYISELQPKIVSNVYLNTMDTKKAQRTQTINIDI